jgi:hypothetical protein
MCLLLLGADVLMPGSWWGAVTYTHTHRDSKRKIKRSIVLLLLLDVSQMLMFKQSLFAVTPFFDLGVISGLVLLLDYGVIDVLINLATLIILYIYIYITYLLYICMIRRHTKNIELVCLNRS